MDNPDYRRIEQAIAYLEEHALEQPSLDEVAEQIGLSSFHFQRLFKSGLVSVLSVFCST